MSNPSTGYDWTVKQDTTMLEFMGYESELTWNTAPGNQVPRVYKFKALKAGNTNITMIYERSLERGFAKSDVLKSIEIPVIIR
ncbi:MAG: protease inhibitor I42 family protein [Candidatus Methanoperedens sp.]